MMSFSLSVTVTWSARNRSSSSDSSSLFAFHQQDPGGQRNTSTEVEERRPWTSGRAKGECVQERTPEPTGYQRSRCWEIYFFPGSFVQGDFFVA